MKNSPALSTPASGGDSKETIQSRAIERVRFPLVLAVIFIHMNPPAAIQGDATTSINLYGFITNFCSRIISSAAVPCFFVISGYLFYRSTSVWNSTQYLRKLKTRTQTLLIPYILWNIIALAAFCGQNAVKRDGSLGRYINTILQQEPWRIFWNCHEWGHRINKLGIESYSSGPLDYPLWFVRDLMICVLLSPLIHTFITKTKSYGIAAFGAAIFLGFLPTFPGFNPNALFHFGFGALFSISGKHLVMEFGGAKRIWQTLCIVSLLCMTIFHDSKAYGQITFLYQLIAPIAILSFAATSVVREPSMLYEKLTHATFFIYASHTILVIGVATKIASWISPSPIISFFLTPAFTAAICFCLFIALSKCFPRVATLLAGGR